MNAVGIDVSKGKSMIAVVRPFGEIVAKPYEVRHTASELRELAQSLKSLDGETRVIMEHTGRYYESIAQQLHEAGIFVSAVNPLLIREYGNNSLRLGAYAMQSATIESGVESLKRIHLGMDSRKAKGVDKVSKKEYQKNLDENIGQLMARMKRQAYAPKATRRVLIDKPESRKKRPLGISCYEDKLVEARAAEILDAVYEPKFYDFSYGFRAKRNCHQALRELVFRAGHGTRYIVEADIRSFFDMMNHEWMLKFLNHDIADRRFLELIRRMLKAKVLDGGELLSHEERSPQGSGMSPVLANVYLHYVLDDWFAKVVERRSKGMASMIRYADDFVCCFEHREDAERFYRTLPKRFAKFGLALAEEKTRIVQFGRFAIQDRAVQEVKKQETFNFLGFTFYCGMNLKKTRFLVKVKSDRKKVASKLRKLNQWLKANRTMPVRELIRSINRSLVGYFHYYGVTWNSNSISTFRYRVVGLLFKWLNRRSQSKSYTWETFYHGLLRMFPVAMPKIYVNLLE